MRSEGAEQLHECIRTRAEVKGMGYGVTDGAWKVIGQGANTTIYEVDDGQLTYEAAKAIAIKQMEECLLPLVERLDEVKSDLYMTKGKRPALKAWEHWSSTKTLVIAKTKKRAMELARESRHVFDNHFRPVEGHWWYQYAQEEGVWEAENRYGRDTGMLEYKKRI